MFAGVITPPRIKWNYIEKLPGSLPDTHDTDVDRLASVVVVTCRLSSDQ